MLEILPTDGQRFISGMSVAPVDSDASGVLSRLSELEIRRDVNNSVISSGCDAVANRTHKHRIRGR